MLVKRTRRFFHGVEDSTPKMIIPYYGDPAQSCGRTPCGKKEKEDKPEHLGKTNRYNRIKQKSKEAHYRFRVFDVASLDRPMKLSSLCGRVSESLNRFIEIVIGQLTLFV